MGPLVVRRQEGLRMIAKGEGRARELVNVLGWEAAWRSSLHGQGGGWVLVPRPL